jgi:cytochrome c-type biogenesis protein
VTGAITADPFGMLAAFGAGILSFLSPCVLPLVPGYVSMVSGLSAAELGGTGRPASSRPLGPLVRGVGLFIVGFTAVFVALGAAASGLGQVLDAHKQVLTTASGAVVLVLGAVFLIGSLPTVVWERLGAGVSGRVGWLVGERRFHVRPGTLGTWAAPVMGMAFAFAWTPCIGPVLAAVLGLAATRTTLAGGVLLLFSYSIGLGVPFMATGVAFDRLTSLYGRARRRLALVQVVAGVVLIAFGVLLVAGDLGWLSAQFSTLLDHLGLQRLTTS